MNDISIILTKLEIIFLFLVLTQFLLKINFLLLSAHYIRYHHHHVSTLKIAMQSKSIVLYCEMRKKLLLFQ